MLTHSYQVQLEPGSLPELLFKLYRHRVPGMVEARCGEIVKRLYVREGSVIYASSSDRADSLGAFLLRQALVSPKDLREVMTARESGERRFGVLLMERGLLSPAMLNAAIRQQVEEVAWSLFSWHEGELEVDLGETQQRNAIEIHIPMRSMILRGIRRTADPKPLIARVGGRDTVLLAEADAEDLVDIGIDEREYELLTSIDGHKTLAELCNAGPLPAAEAAKVLYAFWVLRLVHAKSTENGRAVKIRLRADGRL